MMYPTPFILAGADGSRTHHGPQRDPSPVLKTGEPTGTLPLPFHSAQAYRKADKTSR